MKYYSNEIYPIGLVLSYDVDSVNKEYTLYDGSDVVVKKTAEAETLQLNRRTTDYNAWAVGIVFNTPITSRLMAHEAFHATYFMLAEGLHIPLTDYSDEAWAYLIGWIADCIEDFKDNH